MGGRVIGSLLRVIGGQRVEGLKVEGLKVGGLKVGESESRSLIICGGVWIEIRLPDLGLH